MPVCCDEDQSHLAIVTCTIDNIQVYITIDNIQVYIIHACTDHEVSHVQCTLHPATNFFAL